jgi:hypothetical protein
MPICCNTKHIQDRNLRAVNNIQNIPRNISRNVPVRQAEYVFEKASLEEDIQSRQDRNPMEHGIGSRCL